MIDFRYTTRGQAERPYILGLFARHTRCYWVSEQKSLNYRLINQHAAEVEGLKNRNESTITAKSKVLEEVKKELFVQESSKVYTFQNSSVSRNCSPKVCELTYSYISLTISLKLK